MQLSITNIVLSVSRCCSMCGCWTRQPHGGSHVLHWSGCFYLTACKPVCVHVSVFVCVPQTRCDCPWMLSDFFFFCIWIWQSCLLLCVLCMCFQTLMSSLKVACEILTEDEEGGAARIPFDIFVNLYTYLAHLDGDMPQDHIDKFLSSLQPQV